jgi:hypothetical protein
MSWEALKERVGRWEERMNPEQREAVEAIVKGWNEAEEGEFVFPIVNGPPGTGKTHVAAVGCAKYMLEARERGEKPEVVYLCKTNLACERAREVLFSLGFSDCPPSTTLPEIPLAVRIQAGRGQMRWENGVVWWGEKQGRMETAFLEKHHILLATVDSAGKVCDLRRTFKMAVDEFSQVNAMDFFAAVQRSTRRENILQGVALLGDPLQLPLVTTQISLRTNILNYLRMRFTSRTLPEHELKRQYRMNEVICEGVNRIREEAGAYRLETAEMVRDRKLKMELPPNLPGGIRRALDPDHPLVLVDTSGLGDEKVGFGQVGGERSVSNPGEAELAATLASEVMRARPGAVKVLAPYSAQVAAIEKRLGELIGQEAAGGMVSTIWRAQGQEWPCVIVSLVRNNPDRRRGFLSDDIMKAQIYVAVSRAQAKLVVLAAYERTFEGHRDVDALWETPGALELRGEELRR